MKGKLPLPARWRMQVVIAAVGLAVLCVTGYGFYTGNRLNSVYAPLAEATMEIKMRGANAHLLMEEWLFGDPEVELSEVWAEMDKADSYARAMLEPDPGGGRLIPLRDGDMRRKIAGVREKLADFRAVAVQRFAASETSSAGSEIDQRLDRIFQAYIEGATEVGETLKRVMGRDLRHFRAVQTGLIAACVLLSLFLAAVSYRYEARRARDFLALRSLTENLEQEIAERLHAEQGLREAQEHLEKRVEERTAELSASNELLGREIAERRLAEEALRDSERKLRLLSSHLFSAQEDERKRISLELHDELGQSLAIMKLKLRPIQRQLGREREAWGDELEGVLRYVDQIIDNVHRLSKDLSPSVIEDLGLTSALRYRVEDFARHAGVGFTVELPDLDDRFPPSARTNIYRIFQEALTNVEKHAAASNVSVVAREEAGCVRFCLQDDGRGFDLREVESKCATDRGMGLAAMNERVRMLGGVLDIDGQEGRGTTIAFRLPIEGVSQP
ncbi:MAG: sensor histidine kinase [Deltaproteobacteria bacterium]|nr:sensor histidine kinase [Deltaproteobacteria bacterium]